MQASSIVKAATSYAQSGDASGAKQLLCSLQKQHNSAVATNSYMYDQLIKAFSAKACVEDAMQTLKLMQQHKIPASIYTFIFLLQACTKGKNLVAGKLVHKELIG